MFEKVLVANRGEIAVRIIRACREMGVRTVAVYSEADRRAPHVRQADEAYAIGPALARKSYLRIDRIVAAARQSGAEAIHPGYGFLAENADFARAVEEAGLIFIGPPASAIAAMGDKVAARKIMEEAGVPVVPGTTTGLSDDELLAEAERIGWPLFVKAAAGGGGKGMRLAHDAEELARALGAARREAGKAFGDERIYLEGAVQGARHVEIQVLADGHGGVIHLGERECSIQRRHQKLVEETPSPAVGAELRQRMGRVAVRAAEAVGYVNAGTVEFLLSPTGDFYFLEMNTRLQVEHPITELVTGVDIVHEQLRIAAGERLRHRQEEIGANGWAIECRITAEDPFNNFLPASGRIVRLHQPSGPGVRVDSGIQEGLEVSLYYDPLLAKLIAWGPSRRAAIDRMAAALREYRVVGVSTSIPFHRWLMEEATFRAGTYDTAFLEARAGGEEGLFAPDGAAGEDRVRLAVIAAVLLSHEQRQRGRVVASPGEEGQGVAGWGAGRGWKMAGRWEAMGR